MSIVPPASATLVWAFPTPFDEVRCFVWEHSHEGWSIAILFGDETLAFEQAPTRWAMEAGVDLRVARPVVFGTREDWPRRQGAGGHVGAADGRRGAARSSALTRRLHVALRQFPFMDQGVHCSSLVLLLEEIP